MAVRFNPTGTLDLSTDPADLPSEVSGKIETSGAMQRCTNLHLDRPGIAVTRRGSAKLNTTPIDTSITRIIEQSGNRYAFAGGGIYKDETLIGSGFTSAAWSAVLYNSYATTTQAVFALNGTDRKRIEGDDIYEWGSESPSVPPILKIGGGTGLIGDYNAKYTWARKEGYTVVWESNPSPEAISAITLSSESLLIKFTLPTDTQVTHIRIYRTLTGGAVYYHDQDVLVDWGTYEWAYFYDWEAAYITGDKYQAGIEDTANGGMVMFHWELNYNSGETDNSIFLTYPPDVHDLVDSFNDDQTLGTEASWLNHDRPPLGTVVLGPAYTGLLFILKDNLLYYSLPNQPEYWPATYYIEVTPIQTPIKAAAILMGQLVLASAVEIYTIQGTGPGVFFPLPMSAQIGAINADCFLPVVGYGIFHVGGDGIYQYSAGKDQLMSRGWLDPIFWGETRGNVPGLNRTYIERCWLTVYHGKLYFGYPGGTSEYPDNMIIMDLMTNRIVHCDYAFDFRTVAVDATNNRLLAGDSSGYIWQWENINLTDDEGTAIDWQIQSKDFNQLNKYFPRYARYDVTVNGGSAIGYILMDDNIKQTHTLIGNRQTRKRLVAGCTGDRIAVRMAGSGGVLIYGAEIE